MLTVISAAHAVTKTYNAGNGGTKAEACQDAEEALERKIINYCENKGGSVSGALYSCKARQYDSGNWTASAKATFECR